MPLYEYECEKCGNRFEKIQKFSDPLETTCPKCGGAVHKLVSSPAIQFKGVGFYITDYPKGDKGAAPKSDGGKADRAARADKPTAAEGTKSEKSTTASESTSPAAAPAGGSTASTPAPSAPPASSPSTTKD